MLSPVYSVEYTDLCFGNGLIQFVHAYRYPLSKINKLTSSLYSVENNVTSWTLNTPAILDKRIISTIITTNDSFTTIFSAYKFRTDKSVARDPHLLTANSSLLKSTFDFPVPVVHNRRKPSACSMLIWTNRTINFNWNQNENMFAVISVDMAWLLDTT